MNKQYWPSIFLIAALALVSADSVVGASPTIGKPAPAFVVNEIGGQPFNLSSLHGKVIVLNFWASWCNPCNAELPELTKFSDRYSSQGVVVLAVSIDRGHDRKEAQKIAKRLGISIAFIDDAEANGFDDPNVIPETYVIDALGIVRREFIAGKPAVTEQSLAAAVTPLLPMNK